MSRKFTAAAVMLLCLGALAATASAAPAAADSTPAGGFLTRRLLGASTFVHGLGLGSILGGGGSSYVGSGYGYGGGPYGGGPYGGGPYGYNRPYYGGYNGYNGYRRGGGRRYYSGRKLMMG